MVGRYLLFTLICRMVNWLADHPELVDPSDSIIDSGTGLKTIHAYILII